jgi:hypothetical protein
MSRHESDREDLLREATALVERAELTIPGESASIVVGFRSNSAASLYLGSDCAYHFNSTGQLRRAYVDRLLYKADHGRLVALRRERTEAETALVRVELTTQETEAFIARLQTHLARLRGALDSQAAVVIGQVPAKANLASRILNWLDALPPTIVIARAANVQS